MDRRDFLESVAPALSGGVFSGVAGRGPWLTSGTESRGLESWADQRAAATAAANETAGKTAATDALVTVEEFDEEFSLDPGERRTYTFEFDAETALTYDLILRWGPPQPGVDLLLFGSTEEFRAYLKGYAARYLKGGTILGEANINVVNYTVSPGTYRLAVDNTGWTDGYADVLETDEVNETPEARDGVDKTDKEDFSDGSAALGVDFEFTATQ